MRTRALALGLLAALAARAEPPGGVGCAPYQTLRPPFRKVEPAQGRSPLRFWRKARFDRAFEALCRCYGTLGDPRAECEEQYRVDLERECAAAYGESTLDARALARCRLIADLQLAKVQAGGAAAWRDAQDEARILRAGKSGDHQRRSLKWKLGYPDLVETTPPRVPSSAR